MSTKNDTKSYWEAYCRQELAVLTPILKSHGFTLDSEQKHLKGERYLMHALTTASGKKLILLGKDISGKPVVIKATREQHGKQEILHERTCRTLLQKINFAGEVFHTPAERAFFTEHGFLVSVQEFIDQKCTFLERPVQEQFFLALSAFKAQESAHATTWKHYRLVQNTFSIRTGKDYENLFAEFVHNIRTADEKNHTLIQTLERAQAFLHKECVVLEQYTGFLTHTDFVPHNIRIHDNTMYLLDHSSITFGNKYEGWARFCNFMALYNPELQRLLEQYVRDNRTTEELLAFKLMRMYRLGEIIWYYTKTLSQSTGDLLRLNTARIDFWSTVLTHLENDTPLPHHVLENYKTIRDELRSPEEKERQKGLH